MKCLMIFFSREWKNDCYIKSPFIYARAYVMIKYPFD